MHRARDHRMPLREITTAVLVDGGFYRKRAAALLGKKDPEQRAAELLAYCRRHIRESRAGLYRIFYYDCPPLDKVVYHPLTKEQVNLGKSEQFEWMTRFLKALTRKRKVAVRRGEKLETQGNYILKDKPLKRLCSGSLRVQDLCEDDFVLDITQKGVDMRIGLDIASLAQQKLVNQIVMIAGDSDFVPAAKLARRSGIDFILDPMRASVTDSLNEHIDGVRECVTNRPESLNDPLHVNNMAKELEPDNVDDEM